MIINLRIYISPLCTEGLWVPTAPEANNETIFLIVTAFLNPGGDATQSPCPTLCVVKELTCLEEVAHRPNGQFS